MGASVTPFHWTLPKIGAKDRQLLEVWDRRISADDAAHIGTLVAGVFAKHLGSAPVLAPEPPRPESLQAWVDALPATCLVAVFHAPPHPTPCFLHVDDVLASACIERLLGGEFAPSLPLHPPTETEQGVLQYLCMQSLRAVHEGLGPRDPFRLRFQRFLTQPHAMVQGSDPSAVGLTAFIRVNGERFHGHVGLHFPRAFCLTVFGEAGSRAAHADAAAWQRFDWVTAPMAAEAGMCELTPTDIAGLEAGDVILFDETGVSLHDGRVEGDLLLRWGAQAEGVVRCAVVAGRRLQVRVTGIE
ncbi:MAG: hypothetical protein HY543_09355 [Deltaproteobacteria bacterium]|nr:hypothetical protein [Deltaproteobacteria bacterium]